MRLIDADWLLDVVENIIDWDTERDRNRIIHQVRELTPTVDAEPHWIPVTEEPKKEEKSYWVCLEGGGQCQCRWTNDVYGIGANAWSKWGWKKVDLPHFSKVVAYMPLPEPYKGGDGMSARTFWIIWGIVACALIVERLIGR